MTAETTSPGGDTQKYSGSGLLNLLANAITLVALLLMAVGLIAITANWRSHTIEFVGADRMRLTQSEWWGLAKRETLYRASPAGWVLLRANGDEVPVAIQPIKVSD